MVSDLWGTGDHRAGRRAELQHDAEPQPVVHDAYSAFVCDRLACVQSRRGHPRPDGRTPPRGQPRLSYIFNNRRPVRSFSTRRRISARARSGPSVLRPGSVGDDRSTLNLGLRFRLPVRVQPRAAPAGRSIHAGVAHRRTEKRARTGRTCHPAWASPSTCLATEDRHQGLGRPVCHPAGHRCGPGQQPGERDRDEHDPDMDGRRFPRATPGQFRAGLRPPQRGANGECGAISDLGFGTVRMANRYSQDVLEGSAFALHVAGECLGRHTSCAPNLAVNAGYYRTWYGNFTVTDNPRSPPRTSIRYCIPSPSIRDCPEAAASRSVASTTSRRRLWCGRQSIRPGRDFGGQSQVYDGLSSGQREVPPGRLLSGGMSTGSRSRRVRHRARHPEVSTSMALPNATAPVSRRKAQRSAVRSSGRYRRR